MLHELQARRRRSGGLQRPFLFHAPRCQSRPNCCPAQPPGSRQETKWGILCYRLVAGRSPPVSCRFDLARPVVLRPSRRGRDRPASHPAQHWVTLPLRRWGRPPPWRSTFPRRKAGPTIPASRPQGWTGRRGVRLLSKPAGFPARVPGAPPSRGQELPAWDHSQ